MAVLIPDAIARPTSNSPAVKEKAVRELLPEVIEWLKEDFRPDEENEIIKQLSEVLDGWNDGFKAAKALEDRFHWDGDSELVQILDNFSTYRAEQEAVKAWVKEVQPQPQFKLGDRVIWKQPRGKNIEGEIVKIMEETAQYLVKQAGDVSEGQIGTHGTYVNWEDAEPIQSEQPA